MSSVKHSLLSIIPYEKMRMMIKYFFSIIHNCLPLAVQYRLNSFMSFMSYHIETNPLISKERFANQWTGFYMIETSVMKVELMISNQVD